MKKENKILTWIRGKRRFLDLTKPPKEIRELDMATYQLASCKCFVRLQGGWYKAVRNSSTVLFVTRTLQDLTLQEWVDIAKNDEFTPNMR